MSGVGRLKVRRVGGWAVRKVLNRCRKYIQRNMFTKYISTLARFEAQQIACQLLEGNVIRPFPEVEENSVFPDTLKVTEGRQYQERGLLHISDQATHFLHGAREKACGITEFTYFEKSTGRNGGNGHG